MSKSNQVITRFAPSPTGFLHIGGARTALFNWLYAKRMGGKFLLRIEDTDRERSTQAAVDALIDGLSWLGLNWDGEIVFQAQRAPRHAEVAAELLKNGHAYHCYTSQEELAALREQGKGYDRTWRDKPTSEAPAGVKPVIRLKAPLTGEVIVKDHVRGDIHVPAAQLEDLVILRSDGTPTYNLAVVVDDFDMGITHIIRGEDHITNAAKQSVIYQLMGWKVPEFAHVPLIHGADGAKLSKRHGAIGAEAYRDMGYLPEAMRNYLLRLGWAHGDDETISTAQAIEWFNLEGIGKSPSRFDLVKLDNLNGHYIREADNARLTDLAASLMQEPVSELSKTRILKGMDGLKQRAKTIKELAANSSVYCASRPLTMNEKANEILAKGGKELLRALYNELQGCSDWKAESLQNLCKAFGEKIGKKLGDVAQPLRAALSGSTISPSVFEMMEVLEKEESLGRIKDVL